MPIAPFRSPPLDFPLLNSLAFKSAFNNTVNDLCSIESSLVGVGGTEIFTWNPEGKGQTFNNPAGGSHTHCVGSQGRIVVGSSGGAQCFISDDEGVSFQSAAGIPAANACRGLAADGAGTVVFAGTLNAFTSVDNGSTFNEFALPSFGAAQGGYSSNVTYLETLGLFAICGTGQGIGISEDGQVWTRVQLNSVDPTYPDGNVVAITEYNGNVYVMNTRGNIWNLNQFNAPFVALEDTSYFSGSTDTSNTTFDARCLQVHENILYAGHNNTGMQYSRNGINFLPYNHSFTDSTNNLQCMTSFNGSLYCGIGSSVLQSLQS